MRLSVLPIQKIRVEDSFGSGSFGASRDNGTRPHKGIDLVAAPNTPILAPFSGKITYKGDVYGDSRYKSLHIVNDAGDLRVVMFYAASTLKQGDDIFKGQPIGTVEDIGAKYKGITNHLHLELYKNEVLTDPTEYFTSQIIEKENAIKFNATNEKSSLFSIIYKGGDGISVSDLLATDQFSYLNLSQDEFLSLVYDGISNNKRIYNNLDSFQIEEFGGFSQEKTYPINSGTEFFVRRNSISIKYEYSSNITSSKLNNPRYLSQEINSILNSTEFKKEEYTLSNPQVTVFIWSKNLYQRGKDGFLNITPYIIRCSTNTTMQQGDFSIEVSELNIDSNYDLSDIDDKMTVISKNGSRSKFYFEKLLQQNDLIFIKFEKLEIEGAGEQVPGKWYDMIGMIDAVTLNTTVQNEASVSINIRGRDLSKAMTDDNSYFNPYSLGHSGSIFGGEFNDRLLNGSFTDISAFLARTIEENVEFITSRISTIEYVPSEIFSAWEDLTIFKRASFNQQNYEQTLIANFKGIWSIIKFFVDENLKDLRLVDDAVSNPQGSIWELLGKTAQSPFVEYFGETYGDQYYVIFREPPFTLRALEQAFLANDAIEIEDSISENLGWSNEAYAWYRVHDRGNFAGNTVTLGTSPSLYISEYANIFGNKMYETYSNYSNYKFFEYEGQDRDLDVYAEQQSQHLAFLVESTAYLPFTRQGQIVIEGDRRIKKGSWIYYRPTGEAYYVTGVTNLFSKNMSVERQTILQVERGMIRKHIFDKKNSYFNIIDIKKLKDGVYDTISKGSVSDKFDQKSPIGLNKDVFDFFIQKRHFE